jgi:hypothetical protein
MNGYPPYRSWVYDRFKPHRVGLKPAFISGVKEFVSKSKSRPQFVSDGGIRCPCDKCTCRCIQSASTVIVHLYKYGFQPNYLYWTDHGEEIPRIDPKNVPSSSGHMDNNDPFMLMQHTGLFSIVLY